MKDIINILSCPLCGGAMSRKSGSVVCGNGHSYDMAKSGYVNLLPPGKMNNSKSGDDREMVKARSEFLSGGYYGIISDAVADAIMKNCRVGDIVIADMGCGEGWHTCRYTSGLKESHDVVTIGFDASKYACERACRFSKSVGLMPSGGICDEKILNSSAYFAPANIFHTPIKDKSADVCVSMFAPVAWDECGRILNDGGIIAVVSSARNHLDEMRKVIYDEVHYSDEAIPTAEGWKEISCERITQKVHLPDSGTIQNLFVMTPFYYKTTQAGRQRLAELNELDVTVDFTVRVFEKS